jgi:hypothetical protein
LVTTTGQGQRTDLETSRNFGKLSSQQAGVLLNVGEDSVRKAIAIRDCGIPSLLDQLNAAMCRWIGALCVVQMVQAPQARREDSVRK